MGNIQVLNEVPLSINVLKEKLEQVKKVNKELVPRAQKTYEYLQHFSKFNSKKVEEIKKKFYDLKIPRLKERHVIKLIDIAPKDMDSLKAVFSSESITIKQEDMNRLLEVLKKNV